MDFLVESSGDRGSADFNLAHPGTKGNDNFIISPESHGYPSVNEDKKRQGGSDTYYLSLDVWPDEQRQHDFGDGGGTPNIYGFDTKTDKIVLPASVDLKNIVIHGYQKNGVQGSLYSSAEIRYDPHQTLEKLYGQSGNKKFSGEIALGNTAVFCEFKTYLALTGIDVSANQDNDPEGYEEWRDQFYAAGTAFGEKIKYSADDIGQFNFSGALEDFFTSIVDDSGISLYEYAFESSLAEGSGSSSTDPNLIGRLYTAAFGRVPDEGGLQYWVNEVNDPLVSYKDVSQNFVNSPEFSAMASPNSSSDVFATALYQNVFGRAPDSLGLSYWTNQLNSGLQDRADVLIGFADSPENVALYETLV